jgi:hypothetical protein
MAKLPGVRCPECDDLLESDDYTPNKKGGAPTASGFNSCLRKCSQCGVGLSNAKTTDRLTKIYRDPIPEEAIEYLDQVLGQALNTRNRPNKRNKLQSENSEDAVTWVVFRYLQKQGMLGKILSSCGRGESRKDDREPTLLLWGAAVPPSDHLGQELRERLIRVSDSLGENPGSRSEPDVVLDFGGEGLVVIEAKLRSKNDKKSTSDPHWGIYFAETDVFADEDQVRESGCYELARNWRIGCEIAGPSPFTLVNLAMPSLFAEAHEQERLMQFQSGLAETETHRFCQLTWSDILQCLPKPWPQWFDSFITERRLEK